MDQTAQASPNPVSSSPSQAQDVQAKMPAPLSAGQSSAQVVPPHTSPIPTGSAAGPTNHSVLEKKVKEPEQFSGSNKEQFEGGGFGETVPIIEVGEHEKVPEDVQSWVERLQSAEEIRLPEPIVDDGHVLLSDPVTFKEDRIVLPVAQSTVSKGLKAKTGDSVRWLAVWCVRLMKMFGGRARYQDG